MKRLFAVLIVVGSFFILTSASRGYCEMCAANTECTTGYCSFYQFDGSYRCSDLDGLTWCCGDGHYLGHLSAIVSYVDCCGDSQCYSGYSCVNYKCIIPKRDDGEPCVENSDCKGGYCLHRTCRSGPTYCGDRQCDTGETCVSCPDDCGCATDKVCDLVTKSCVGCTEDANCKTKPNLKCEPDRQICVMCLRDADCGGKKCDLTTFTCAGCISDADCPPVSEWSGKYECSAGKDKVIETGIKKTGTCSADKTCVYSAGSPTTQVAKVCTSPNPFCYDGKCGCPDGYDTCMAANDCKQKSALDVNSPCKCDFECKSTYCKNEVCVNPVTVGFSTSQVTAKAGEKTRLTFTVDNNLNKAIDAKIIVTTGSGVSIASAEAQSCSGNQCTIFTHLGERAQKAIELEVAGTESANVSMTARLSYDLENKTYELLKPEITELVLTKCGNGVCEAGESVTDCKKDCGSDTFFEKYGLFLGIGVVVVLAMAMVLSRPATKGGDTKTQLRELEGLYKDKLISKDEYDEKRKKLLEKI